MNSLANKVLVNFNRKLPAMLIVVTVFSVVVNFMLLTLSSQAGGRCLDGPIDWTVESVESLNLQQIGDYLSWKNSSSCGFSQYFGGYVVFTFAVDGQRAVCLDDQVRPERASGAWPLVVHKDTECLVYSFGINNEWSFDEAMEDFGCRVFAFDPSMNVTTHNRTSKIHFFNLGLSDRDETLPEKNWTMKSLDSIYNNLLQHRGRIIDYLKIDVEFSEWDALPQIIASGMMDRVRQLAVEVHLVHLENTENSSFSEIRNRIQIIKSLEDYGLVRFDSIPNPWAYYDCLVDGVQWVDYTAYDMVWFNPKIARQNLK